MKRTFSKQDILFSILAAAGFILFLVLFPGTFPEASFHMQRDRNEIIETARTHALLWGFDVSEYKTRASIVYDADQLYYLQKKLGHEAAYAVMRDSIPVFSWQVQWKARGKGDWGARKGDQAESGLTGTDGEIRMNLDFSGNPIGFKWSPEDRKGDGQDTDSVFTWNHERSTAMAFFYQLFGQDTSGWSLADTSEKSSRIGRVREFRWIRSHAVSGENMALKIEIVNGRLLSFQRTYEIPEAFQAPDRNRDVFGMLSFVFVYLTFIIIGIVTFVKRIRADLLDLKSGLIPGIIVLFAWTIVFWTQSINEPFWEMLFGFILTTPFLGGGLWAMFVLGESYTREVWAEKLAIVDHLRRRWFFPALGASLIRGILLVFIGLGVLSLISFLSMRIPGAYFSYDSESLDMWASPLPGLSSLGFTTMYAFYTVATFILFFISFLKRTIRRKWLFALILLVIWMFIGCPLPKLMPISIRLIVNALTGLMLVIFFYRTDFISVLVGAFGIPIVYDAFTLLQTGAEFYQWNGLILLAVPVLIIIWAGICHRSPAIAVETATYVPDYLKRIYEKERIHRELEIARNIQMTFLPRVRPQIKGVDVASYCVPAEEIGGDYYDFIEIDPRRLGVAVGDVSGKGIPAAFYMTLTKGFLQAQAKSLDSPRAILINMNDLFYRNAERNIFISMIYGVIDLTSRTLTFARAGHNPVMLRRSGGKDVEELCPPGLALGLKKGELFEKTIEERKLGISSGDIFLFYTDGLNEARNRLKETFDEERIKNLIQRYATLSAEDMLNAIRREVQLFTQDAPQHDDMTAVLIKIL